MEPALKSQKAGLQIRRASPAELDAAYAIVQEYYAAVQVVVRESKERFAQDYFAAAAGVWLGRMDGKIAGCIALRALGNAEAAEIKRMYVRPAWRGQGMAQELLKEAERFALKNGYQWIYLDTADGMLAAAQLYRQNGYKFCERYNDNPQATIFMRKQLQS